MPRPSARRTPAFLLATRCAAATLAWAATATLAPADASEPIPWQQAGDHVGRRIVVEGVVVATRSIDAGCVLAFTGDAEHSPFTVTLVTPLFTRGPARPEDHYRGKKVRVTGVVRRLAGHSPGIVVRNPAEIVVVEAADLAAPSSASASASTSVDNDPAPGSTAPESATGTEGAARPHVGRSTDGGSANGGDATAEATAQQPAAARCAEARTRWRDVGIEIETALDALSECVRSERYRCRPEAESVYAAMAELAAAEGAIEASCP